MTAMAAALERSGYSKARVELFPHLIRFVQQGGTVEELVDDFHRAAERLRSKGHKEVAESGRQENANAAPSMQSKGQRFDVENDRAGFADALPPKAGEAAAAMPKGQLPIADPAPQIPGKGHMSSVREDQSCRANAGNSIAEGGLASAADKAMQRLPTIREPSSSRRAAMVEALKTSARSIFDSKKTSRGDPWGDVRAHELPGMDRDGAIARRVQNHLGTLTGNLRFRPIRELLKADEFEAIIHAAEHPNDAD